MPKDTDGVIAVIDSVYREYGDPGVDLKRYDSDLLDVQKNYREKGGEFVVLDASDDGPASDVRGCHAVVPVDREKGLVTFRRLYLSKEQRGTDCGYRLMQWAVDWTREQGYKRVEFWSDVRFERAHRFFKRFGFQTTGETRTLTDFWVPYTEYFFWLDL